MDLERVEKLIQLMRQYDLNELQLSDKDWEFAASRGGSTAAPVVVSTPAHAAHPAPAPAGAGAAPAPVGNTKEITSPLVGTFYRSPSPDQPAYKQIGDRVSPDDVICIVEAMKVMNEIKAGVAGTLVKALVENQSPVEYGQPLFLVELG